MIERSPTGEAQSGRTEEAQHRVVDIRSKYEFEVVGAGRGARRSCVESQEMK